MDNEHAGQGPVERVVRPGAEAARLAEAIDPLRRKVAPDHLTVGCAAQMLESQAAEIERLRAAMEAMQVAAWRVEYGSVGLPADDPARITGVAFYETEAEAAVACDEMDFNSIITPLYAAAGGPNAKAHRPA